MADAPEVAPQRTVRASMDAPELVSDLASPDSAGLIPDTGKDKGAAEEDAAFTAPPLKKAGTAAEKIALNPDEPSPAYTPNDEKIVEPSAEAGCRPLNPDNATEIMSNSRGLPGDGLAQEQLPSDGWSTNFWDICGSPSLAIEAFTCPCVLAGRTYTRIKPASDEHQASTNVYCLSCCLLSLPLAIGLPVYLSMTIATRREIRYRYNIQGSNCDDCWRSALCLCCSLVQEEKEVLARKQKNAAETEGYAKRNESMVYRPSN